MPSFPCSYIPKIRAAEWKRIEPLLRERRRISCEEIRKAAGIPYSRAMAVFLALHGEKHVRLFLLVHHKCQKAPVKRRGWMRGFQPTPWRCPACEVPILDADALRYDIQVSIPRPITLIPTNAPLSVACEACGRVVRARPDGHPFRHKPKSRLRGFKTTDPSFCDGTRYRGRAV